MNFRKKVDKILGTFLIVIMAIMVINVLWQVFTRFVVGSPSSFTDELARYLMIWLSILGAAYVSGKNMHVAIDVLQSNFSEETNKKIKFLIHSLVIAFSFFALIIGGARLVYITYILDQQSPALQIPLAVVYSVLPLAGALIIYYKIFDLKNI